MKTLLRITAMEDTVATKGVKDRDGRGASNKDRRQKFKKSLEMVNEHSAGLDLHQEKIWACAGPFRDGVEPDVKTFGTYTRDLRLLAQWLKSRGVTSVAMESTGVYWIPPFHYLRDRGFKVMLVNSRETKAISGRPKTDNLDCIWICRLHSYGLLSGSFIPSEDVEQLRCLWQCRKKIVDETSRAILRMQKALTTMNCRLEIAVSAINGVSGMRIIEAILAGERDPKRLAAMSEPGVKMKKDEIEAALEGSFKPAQLEALAEWLTHYKFYQERLAAISEKILELLKRFPRKEGLPECPPAGANYKEDRLHFREPLRPLLYNVFGADLTALPGIGAGVAMSCLATIGAEVSAFPTEGHFVSWLGLSPNLKISAGHQKKGRVKRIANILTESLKHASMTCQRTDSMLGADYRRRKSIYGGALAKMTIARKLAIILYRILKYGQPAIKYSAEAYERLNSERRLKRLKKQARTLGFELAPLEATA